MSKENAKNLAEFFKRAKDTKEAFHIFIGAGCSISAGIPSANGLVDRINKDYEHVLNLKNVPQNERRDYMSCMGALNFNQRQKLIKEYVDDSKINWASIVLAQLMKEGYVSRVLSFNFDNVLSKSCSLQGIYPAIYDFTVSNPNLHELIVDPAIVHLHGQSDGFNQFHDKEQTAENAEKLNAFISSTFINNPCIFMGYSGEADQFFDVIVEQYKDRHDLFWMYRSDSFPNSVKSRLIEKSSNAHLLEWEDADLFLINLAQKLEIFPPPFLANPYNHLLSELNKLADFPKDAHSTRELFVETKAKLEEDAQNHEEVKGEDYDQLFLSGDTDKVIEKLKNKPNRTPDEDKALADAYFSIGFQYHDKADETENNVDAIVLFNQAAQKYQQAIAINPDFYEAFNNLGNVLSDLAERTEDNEKTIGLLNEAADKYQQAIAIKPDFYVALNNWGNALIHLIRRVSDTEKQPYIEKAFEVLLKVKVLNPDGVYNLACLYSVTEDFEKTQETLLHCEKSGTLPTKQELEEDKDMDNLRELGWFKELLERLDDSVTEHTVVKRNDLPEPV